MYTVTEKAQRPARMDGHCFYCQEKIGGVHKPHCVLIRKNVRVRMTVEYDVEVPAHWDSAIIEDARNKGAWCSNNAINELKSLAKQRGCLCGLVKYDCLEDVAPVYLHEDGGLGKQ